MAKKTNSKDINKVLELAEAQGCEIKMPNRRGHIKLIVPGRGAIPVARTPSDANAHKQIIRQLRKLGINIVM